MRLRLLSLLLFAVFFSGCGLATKPDELTVYAGHSWYNGSDRYSEEAYNTKGTEISVGVSLMWDLSGDNAE